MFAAWDYLGPQLMTMSLLFLVSATLTYLVQIGWFSKALEAENPGACHGAGTRFLLVSAMHFRLCFSL